MLKYSFEKIKNRYKIMSRTICEKYCNQKHYDTSIIISIKSTWDKTDPQVFCSDINNVKDILFLSFDDIDFEDGPDGCMTVKDGVAIADFVNKWNDKIDKIIVHCDGGISRSAGVCAAIMRVTAGDDYIIFHNKNKAPNMTCYLNTLKGFKYI